MLSVYTTWSFNCCISHVKLKIAFFILPFENNFLVLANKHCMYNVYIISFYIYTKLSELYAFVYYVGLIMLI